MLVALRPTEWCQQIRHFPTINIEDRYLRCVTEPDCDLRLSDGSTLRDHFSSIDFSIIEGVPKPDDLPKKRLREKAIGGIWYNSDSGGFSDYVHGSIFLKSDNFVAVWDQVRDGGYVDCLIQLGVEEVDFDYKLDAFVWNIDSPLSIDSATIQFTRKPIATKPIDKPAPTRRGLFRRAT